MKQVAIVGCGEVSKRHIENMGLIGQLAAVCDIDASKADAFAKATASKGYNSFEELLASEPAIDLVLVCTPNGVHAEHIIKSLQAGKDVVTESPLCLTKAAAWQIVETEKFCRRNLFVVQTARYNPIMQELRNRLGEKDSDKVCSFSLHCNLVLPMDYFAGWKGTMFPGGGVLYDPLAHFIDLIVFLFGEIENATGFITNATHPAIEIEDTGSAALQMKSGLLGNLNWSINTGESNHVSLTIITEKETIVVDEKDLTSNGFYTMLYNDLALAFTGGNTAVPSVCDGLKTVEGIEKIYKAIR